MNETISKTKEPMAITASDIRRERLARRLDALVTVCSRDYTDKFDDDDDETDEEELKRHDKARDAAEEIYRQAASAAAAKIQEEKNKKKREAAILLLLLLAGEEAYRKTYSILGTKELLNRDETQIEQQAITFAESRQAVLKKYAKNLSDSIAESEASAAKEKLSATATVKAIRETAEKVSSVMAQVESQVTYGVVQDDRLKRAGVKTKRWQTCEDDRVRPTHEACQLQGAIPINRKFSNGLRFPGDPAGEIQEIAGCRCWLVE